MRLRLHIPLVFLLAAAPAAGVTPHLVKDINPIAVPGSLAPSGFVTVVGLTFFSGNDGDTGRELWRTDGMVAGTFQVADACLGVCSGDPGFIARTERSYFFRVPEQDITSRLDTLSELWVSSGLPSDTFRLTGKLRFPRPLAQTRLWIASQGLLYFAADDGVHGMELWRSDGTPAGTFQVADISPEPFGSEPADLAELNGRLFFRADDGVHGPGLWTSDGTERGTRLVLDPVPGEPVHGGPILLGSTGRNLFFLLRGSGDQLWKSDGTARGSALLTTFLYEGVLDSTVLGKRLLLVVNSPKGQGQELWASDGTSRGTQALTHFADPEAFFGGVGQKDLPLPQSPLGKRLIFPVSDGVHGIELWITDGSPKGTRLLKDACPGACSSLADFQNPQAVSGNLLFFAATDGAHGTELWATDGTSAGTRIVRDLCPGSCDSTPFPFSVGAGKVFVKAAPDGNVRQLWRSDGTAPGTVQLTSFQRAGDLDFGGAALGEAFLFTANDGQHGRELWRSGGTPESTGLLADLNTSDAGGSEPTNLVAAGGKLYFIADDGLHGPELWTSDGTDAGTGLAYEFFPGGGRGPASRPSLAVSAEIDGKLVFLLQLGRSPNDSYSLWRTDGTPAGTTRLSPENLRIDPSVGLRAVGNQVFFVASDADHGEELWVTDGTTEGTRLVKDLEPGARSSDTLSLMAFQGKLYFAAFTSETTSYSLWQSDGTISGTVLVKDLELAPHGGSDSQLLTEHAGRLYFMAQDEKHGLDLWSTDGTPTGTSLIADLNFSFPAHLDSAGSRLFISNHDLWVSDGTAAGTKRIGDTLIGHTAAVFNGDLYFTDSSADLWKSDGTEAGTVALTDRDGHGISRPISFQVFAGRLYFITAADNRLYQSDGTPTGTFRILDLAEPRTSLYLFELKTAGPRLFFRKWDHSTGTELWALE